MQKIFTGCFVGLFSQGGGTAWFDYLSYEHKKLKPDSN
jgi:hypothetical protein